MAATSTPSTVEPLSKPVQQLQFNSNELPERYIYKNEDGIRGVDTSLPLLDVPAIDLGLLTSSPSAIRDQEVEKLRFSLRYYGCFQAVNHGIPIMFLDKVHGAGKKFFALPDDEKQKYSRTAADPDGYGNDVVISDNHTLDWHDRLSLTARPHDQKRPRVWPEEPKDFGETLEEYVTKIETMNEIILKAMAESLNIDAQSFLNQCGDGATIITRFNFYSPCPRPDLIFGAKQHADSSVMTYLLQDKEVEGLQVLKDGQWFNVPNVPHVLFVNVGDQAEIMSNGIFKSPLHRVVTKSDRERMSVAVFFFPNANKEIEPVDELISEETPRLYRKVKNYIDLFFQTYQFGKRPMDTVAIKII